VNLKRERLERWKLDVIRARLEKLNRRAEVLGVQPLALTVTEHKFVDEITGEVHLRAAEARVPSRVKADGTFLLIFS
jgi:hypothetical protein